MSRANYNIIAFSGAYQLKKHGSLGYTITVMSISLSEELKWRGFVNQSTLRDITVLDKKQLAFYWGVDPSADSMTIGNLATAMMVKHFIKAGHKAVLLVGGATGYIGDPDGKSEERKLKSPEEISANSKNIVEQYKRIFQGCQFDIVDNYEWFKDIKYIEFLRETGKHVPMRQMLGREFVQTRLGEGGTGISYAEFSYVLMQAYDFLRLYRDKSVTLQVCGSDQWGNSIAGVDLIRRIEGAQADVWSAPLVVDKSTGVKYGKTEKGAVWLDEKKTSPYRFYQFWLNIGDGGVESALKVFTELDKNQIDQAMGEFRSDKSSRIAQKALADEVTRLVHGEKRAGEVKRATEVLFGGGDYQELGKTEKQILRDELKVVADTGDMPEVLVEAGLASSKSEARNFLKSGAIYVNGQKAGPKNLHLFVKGDNLLKRGKNSFAIVHK